MDFELPIDINPQDLADQVGAGSESEKQFLPQLIEAFGAGRLLDFIGQKEACLHFSLCPLEELRKARGAE